MVATIFICKANYKSANALKKQLEEMREQYLLDLLEQETNNDK